MAEKIEILSLEFFDTYRDEMGIVERMQRHFNQGIGWHYYLDLAWMVREIRGLPKGSLILDAGAGGGGGLAQFILAELGYNVISADFASRVFPRQKMKRYAPVIHYLNGQGEVFDNRYTRHLEKARNIQPARQAGAVKKILGLFGRGAENPYNPGENAAAVIEKNRRRPKNGSPADIPQKNIAADCGRIFLYKCDLKDMPLLPDGLVDGVVSMSALEHNDQGDFEKCVDEILRVTKPGGVLAITVSASQGGDWLHEPSQGWCYSEATLKKLFRLPEAAPGNYGDRERLFELLKKEGNELHKRLAPVYFKSGDNGMPWGRWDPKYQPVGVVKIKD